MAQKILRENRLLVSDHTIGIYVKFISNIEKPKSIKRFRRYGFLCAVMREYEEFGDGWGSVFTVWDPVEKKIRYLSRSRERALRGVNALIRKHWAGPEWRVARNNALKDYMNCASCGSKSRLQIHHKKKNVSRKSYLSLENTIVLCYRCHTNRHRSGVDVLLDPMKNVIEGGLEFYPDP